MTAEIAVINKSAIALAADSAVTISSGISSKIYNGAEKLFALTKYHPVGIMVYGTGNLCSIPWELIIKQYRKQLGTKCFDTLDAYAEDFWQFLSSAEKIIPCDYREYSLKSTYMEVYNILFTLVDEEGVKFIDTNNRKPDDQETQEIIINCCNGMIETFNQCPFFNDFSDETISNIKQFCDDATNEILSIRLEEISLPQEIKEKISYLFALITCKQNDIGVNTGVVFAGYGEKEFFPAVLAFNVRGFIDKKLRYSPDPHRSSAAGQSGLRAYAQDGEVRTFMTGINPILNQDINNTFDNAITNILIKANEIIESQVADPALSELFKKQLVDEALSQWKAAIKQIDDIKRNEHIDKVVNMIEFLPKEELAYMAESLVNMTAFKRKISNESETVGGPIDVAIISKGDGFIWVKRKHYFKKELNNHYFMNFLQGDAHDN